MSHSSGVMRATVGGAIWNYAAFAVGKALLFLSTVILARLLAPDDFGLLALGMVAIAYLETLGDMGVAAAVVYRQDDAERTASVAFFFNLLTGTLLTAIGFAIAPLVAAFFHEPRVTPILQALSFQFVIDAVGNIHHAFLLKSLNFRRRFISELGRTLIKGIVSVALAWLGFGVWSLVWGQLVGAAVSSVLYWLLSGWKPKWVFDLKIARSILGYGTQMTLVDVIGMIHKNVDYLIVGRRLDSLALGFYSMAFRVPEMVIVNICYVVSQAVFSAYARLQNDLQALRQGFLSTLRYVSLLTVPAGVGLFVISPEFVRVFYTERWAPAIPAMQALAIYALIYSLSFNAGDIYKATGRPNVLNYLGIVKLIVTVPILWLAAQYGFYYVAVGQAATTFVLTAIRLAVVGRIISVSPSAMFESLRPALFSASVMLIGSLAVRLPLLETDPLVRMIVLILAGGLLYGGALWITDRALMRQIAEFGGKFARGTLSSLNLRRKVILQ